MPQPDQQEQREPKWNDAVWEDHCRTLHVSFCHCGVESKKATMRGLKQWQSTLAILSTLSASIVSADDFKTVGGKEYKNVTVSRVEADGIVVKGKSGISKIYFVELPKDIQQRFHYNTAPAAATPRQRQLPLAPTAPAATAPTKRTNVVVQAKQDARKSSNYRREREAPLARGNSNDFARILSGGILVIVIFPLLLVTFIITIVAVVNANARKQKRALLVKQAQEFIENVKQTLKLPVVATDIILKPDENAVYSSPSVLHETRAVREYRAAHTGVRVAKGIYVGGTSGRSLSKQQWAKIDTGCLTLPSQTNGWCLSARKSKGLTR